MFFPPSSTLCSYTLNQQRKPGLRSLWLTRCGVMAGVLSDLEELDSLVSNNASNLQPKQVDSLVVVEFLTL